MKSSVLEYFILYVLVICSALLIATLARVLATSILVDGFTTFMAFVIALVIQIVVYLSIHAVLQNLMLPWIGRGLAKISYFRRMIEQRQAPPTAVDPQNSENNTDIEIETPKPYVYIGDIRNEQQQSIAKERKEKLNVALDYIRKSFALYLSDDDLDVLCRNVRAYMNKLEEKELKPVKVKELSAIDLRHFGWNIWTISNQETRWTLPTC